MEKIIADSGLSKTKFAYELGLNKSFMLRVIHGDKKLSSGMTKAILSHPKISGNNKALLRNYYYSELFGKTHFEQVLCSLEEINSFPSKLASRYSVYIRTEILDETFQKLSIPYTINSANTFYEIVSYFSKYALTDSNSFFYSNYPFHMEILDKLIYSIFAERDLNRNFDFKHLVSHNTQIDKNEISLIFQAIKWGSIFCNTLMRTTPCSYPVSLFPYYIITNNAVITFNNECQQGFVFTERSVIDYYQRNFYDSLAQYSPMINFYYDDLDFATNIELSSQYRVNHIIDGSACVALSLDYEILNSIAADSLENKDYLINFALNHYDFGINHQTFDIYNSLKGLKNFAENGDLAFISKKYVKAMAPDMRAKVLKNLLNMVKNDTFPYYVFDDSLLQLPVEMSLSVYQDTVMFGYILKHGQEINSDMPISFTLNYDADRLSLLIENFITYITDNNYIFSKEFTERILNDLIAKNQYDSVGDTKTTEA